MLIRDIFSGLPFLLKSCCCFLLYISKWNKWKSLHLSVSLWFLLGRVSDSVQKSSGPLQVDIARSAGSVLGLSLTSSLYRNKQVITVQKIKPASVADRWAQIQSQTDMKRITCTHTLINDKSIGINLILNNYFPDSTLYLQEWFINQAVYSISIWTVGWYSNDYQQLVGFKIYWQLHKPIIHILLPNIFWEFF